MLSRRLRQINASFLRTLLLVLIAGWTTLVSAQQNYGIVSPNTKTDLKLADAIAGMNPRPKLVTSIRDLLQERVKPGRNEETVELLNRHFDLVMVHGDPKFSRLEETFPLAAEIRPPIGYTGLVAAPPPAQPKETFEVLISAGGGAAGVDLVNAAVEAARLLPDVRNWALIAGPNLPQADYDAAAAAAPEVRAGRLHPVGRRVQHLLDRAPTEAATGLGDRHAEPIAGHSAAHEHHVAVDAADPFTTEGEVIDDELQRVAASRFRHGGGHYKRGVLRWPAAGGREYHGAP